MTSWEGGDEVVRARKDFTLWCRGAEKEWTLSDLRSLRTTNQPTAQPQFHSNHLKGKIHPARAEIIPSMRQ